MMVQRWWNGGLWWLVRCLEGELDGEVMVNDAVDGQLFDDWLGGG